MPEAKTAERARKAQRRGKAPTTAAGELVREEMRHVRRSRHVAASPRQIMAIGLVKARRAGIEVPGPKKEGGTRRGRKTASAGRSMQTAERRGRRTRKAPARARSAATARSRTTAAARKGTRKVGGTRRSKASARSRARS